VTQGRRNGQQQQHQGGTNEFEIKGSQTRSGAKQDLNEKRKVDAPEIMNGLERYTVKRTKIECERNNFLR
jgi:hypothetical protein